MVICLEKFLLVNFCMDFLILLLIARKLGFFQLQSVICASIYGTLYAVFDLCSIMAVSERIIGSAAALFTMSLLAYGKGIARAARGCVMTMAAMLFAGAIQEVISRAMGQSAREIVVSMLASVTLLAAALEKRREMAITLRAWYHIKTRYGTARIEALVDTGNRLTEPISGLPILIVEERLLAPVLPAGWADKRALKTRAVSYAALGGQGLLNCFRADEVRIRIAGRWLEAPDLWIGIYTGRMNRSVHAIAPYQRMARGDNRILRGARKHELSTSAGGASNGLWIDRKNAARHNRVYWGQ